MKILSILLNIVCISMASCFSQSSDTNEKSNQEDDFYKKDVGWDYARVPLIKPYEIVKLKGQKQWIMNLHTSTLDTAIPDIKKVNVTKGVIILHVTEDTYLRGEAVPEAWFVVIPEKQIETGFAKKEDFLAYLNILGIKDPKLYEIDQVFNSFQKKHPIDWEKDFI